MCLFVIAIWPVLSSTSRAPQCRYLVQMPGRREQLVNGLRIEDVGVAAEYLGAEMSCSVQGERSIARREQLS